MLGKIGLRQVRGPACYGSGLILSALLTFASGCGMMATGQNMQGVRLYEKGELYGATEQFQKAMMNNPDDANAYYNMASTLHRMGTADKNQNSLQQAETQYNECLNRDPNHAACYRGLAVLLAQTDRSDKAFVLLKNWALSNPQSADARVELARIYQEYGDTKTAELQLQQALQLDQTNQRAWTAMASLRESKGDYQQALANYQRAYVLNGYNPALANRIAELNRATAGTPGATPRPGEETRTVNAPMPTARY